jgi:hypothetical protein
MHKNATKCNKTLSKWCKNKHGATKIIDTFETYQAAAVAVCLLPALGAGSYGGAATDAVDGRDAVKRPQAGATLGFGAAADLAAVTPRMEYEGVKGVAPSESMADGSEEWRRAGTRGVFSQWLGFTRSMWLFTRAGARAAYLVRGIVQNGARKNYLQRARNFSASIGAAKIRLRAVYW